MNKQEIQAGLVAFDNIKLHRADCMEIMAGYPDNYFDLAVTSPPYNMNLRVNANKDGYCSRQIVEEISTKYKNLHDNMPMMQYSDWLNSVVSELLRVSRLTFFNIQMVTGNKPALLKMMGEFSFQVKEVIIWDKGSGQPAIGKGVLNSCYEFIIVLSNDSITRAFNAPFRGTVDNIFRITPERSSIPSHAATFPVCLASKIFKTFGDDGMRTFDPFLGTGTSAIAAHYAKMGEFVGCELDQDYYDTACERIYKETRQQELF